MKITLHILNPERHHISESDVCSPTWYDRTKSYETDSNFGLDEDIINSPIGHSLERIVLNEVPLCSKSQIEELEKFLKNAKESFFI